MPSFGEKLKLEREKRKITLEQISVSTKIGTRMLQALEEDKFNQLPGGIFNKGFVRAYSRCVGLDEDQTVADYLQASGDAPPVSVEVVGHDGPRLDKNDESVHRLEASSDAQPRQIPWGLLAAVLLLIALALSLWSHRQRENKKQAIRPASTSEGQVSGTDAGAVSSSSSPSSGSQGSGSPGARVSTSGMPNSNLTGGGSGPQVQTAPNAAGSVAVALSAAPGEFSVVLQTREDSWISVTADGRDVSSELVPAGSQRVAHAREQIVVKVGNVGGVDFLFNGKKLDIGGEFGEVKTLTFGPRGVLPSAPAPAETP